MKAKHAMAILSALCLWGCQQGNQDNDFFQPYTSTDLRLPSVPLIVNDPYFSIWSPFDKLTDGTTRHWTDREKPLTGLLRVDGVTYRFMGTDMTVYETVVPMASEEAWEGRMTRQKPSDGWEQPAYNDNTWEVKKAAFGSNDKKYVNTKWDELNSDMWVRRTISISAEDLKKDLIVKYSHDDAFEMYINGTKVIDTGDKWADDYLTMPLEGEQKELLHEGENMIAVHCHNKIGGAYIDFGFFKNTTPANDKILVAEQKSVDVLATNTYYTFGCGPVDLDVVFTAPMLIDDLDLLSMPINYISTQVRSTDGKAHSVQLYLSSSTRMAVDNENQPTVSKYIVSDGISAVRTGTIDQPILNKTGDGICIDWGYFYLPAVNGDVTIGSLRETRDAFVENGKFADNLNGKDENGLRAYKVSEQPDLAYLHDYGTVEKSQSFAMMGYDEVQDIEYMYHRYKAYWAHEGEVTITQAFREMKMRYTEIMSRCRQLDKRIYEDGMAVGGKQYAEILSGSYRHVIAAHKLFQDEDGNLLFFSKENNSNGCVNTVDLTYPEAPLFLVYNPELEKAMMTSILEYSYSGRWTKPFAAHDLGTYPKADGQVYGGDMPLEEAGNMLTLAATLCKLDGNTSYVDKYWDVLTTWADYLSENGQDPENQLCTDDFAGHWPHNCNLSLKAIFGVAGYGLMAQMKGDAETGDKYLARAKEMAQKWEEMALEGDHYRLAFDKENTWSQKYNMIWDKLWGTHILSDQVFENEIQYYLTVQNKYGLPLDCRRDYTKSDWIMWTAGMSPDQETFEKFVGPVYTYINETKSRVPISDWSDTKTANMVGFKARSVIGGYWMRVLTDKLSRQNQ